MLLGDMAMKTDGTLDLDALLHPARAFAHPRDVLADPDLTTNEKRAILASWASDACAVEAAPALRQSPSGKPVAFYEIMDALRTLDDQARQHHAPKINIFGRRFRTWRRRDSEGGSPQQSLN